MPMARRPSLACGIGVQVLLCLRREESKAGLAVRHGALMLAAAVVGSVIPVAGMALAAGMACRNTTAGRCGLGGKGFLPARVCFVNR